MIFGKESKRRPISQVEVRYAEEILSHPEKRHKTAFARYDAEKELLLWSGGDHVR